ncbi:type II secretion system ATPase GspE [Kordiimonas sediminis]
MTSPEQSIILLPYGFARTHGYAACDGEPLTVYRRQGASPFMLGEVRRALGRPFALHTLATDAFEQYLSDQYAADSISEDADDAADDTSLSDAIEGIEVRADLLAGDDDAPVIRLINSIMAQAVKSGASDVHLEPFDSRMAVRLRIDGVLKEVAGLSAKLIPYLVSRIKVMARLDIAEKRIPQDGRISLGFGGQTFDVRVSTLPARYGERVVLRILDAAQTRMELTDLGIGADVLPRLQKSLREPNGILLVTGPTGSGKTTTLYAALSQLNDQQRNIMTVEDPVEYALNGVSQTQVNTKVGMTFASGLRAILRQDPDVIMVGEVRDIETAEMAVQASLTGHLVLSTVHTNSAIAAVTRLRDMGVESFLLASTVKGILAQRLVRRLCEHCKSPIADDGAHRAALGLGRQEPADLHAAVGCAHCNGTGYKGRIGIYEYVVIDNHLRAMIQDGTSEQAMAQYAFAEHDTLSDAGLKRLLAGDTTLEELLRVATVPEDGDASL